MVAKNDVTGDSIRTKGALSEQGRNNYDLIFKKKDKERSSCKCETCKCARDNGYEQKTLEGV